MTKPEKKAGSLLRKTMRPVPHRSDVRPRRTGLPGSLRRCLTTAAEPPPSSWRVTARRFLSRVILSTHCTLCKLPSMHTCLHRALHCARSARAHQLHACSSCMHRDSARDSASRAHLRSVSAHTAHCAWLCTCAAQRRVRPRTYTFLICAYNHKHILLHV